MIRCDSDLADRYELRDDGILIHSDLTLFSIFWFLLQYCWGRQYSLYNEAISPFTSHSIRSRII